MVSFIFLILSGFLTGLSFNFSFLSFLPWISLIPFVYLVKEGKLKEGVIGSLLFGAAYYATIIFWISNVTKLGLIALLFYLSFYPLLFFLLGRYFFKKPFSIVSLPFVWLLLEFFKESVWCGFSWGNLGYSQYRNLYLVQVADLFGTKFVSFLIVMVNVFIVEAFFNRKHILRKSIFCLLIIFSCIGYSVYKLHTLEESGSVKLSLVQPDVPQELKWQDSAKPALVEKLKVLGQKAQEDTLVVFPEASWPFVIDEDSFKQLKQFVKDLGKGVLIGAVQYQDNKFYNTAVYFEKIRPKIQVYRKIKLVPFGEYIPLRKYLGFIKIINAVGDMSRGQEYMIFQYKRFHFSVLICFEDIFPVFVSRMAQDSDFMINITNDAWFGGEPEASQHLGIMVMRAIENRISIARCANTGITGWVSFKGNVETLKVDGQDVAAEGVDDFTLSLNRKRSFYNEWGQVMSVFAGIFLIGIVIVDKRHKGV